MDEELVLEDFMPISKLNLKASLIQTRMKEGQTIVFTKQGKPCLSLHKLTEEEKAIESERMKEANKNKSVDDMSVEELEELLRRKKAKEKGAS